MAILKTLGKIIIKKVLGSADQGVRCPECGRSVPKGALINGVCFLCWHPGFKRDNSQYSSHSATCKICGKSKHPDGIKDNICLDCLFNQWQSEPRPQSHDMTLAEAYSILECDRNCSDETIRSSYRRLAKLFHPDIVNSKGLHEDFTGFAKEKFQEIGKAYELVMDSRNNTNS
jgi:hypothetical protein